MAASQAAVSVTTTATLMVEAGWYRAEITNAGPGTFYIGYTSDVTPATGTPVPSGQQWADSTTRVDSPPVYGVTASGTGDSRVLRA